MDSKKILVNVLRIKKIAIWSAVSCGCLIVLTQWVQAFMADTAQGKEIFIPGVSVLAGAALLVLIYSITRVVKYIKMFFE